MGMRKPLGQGLTKLGEHLCEKAGIDSNLVTEIDIKISAENATEITFHIVDEDLLDSDEVDSYINQVDLISLDQEL